MKRLLALLLVLSLAILACSVTNPTAAPAENPAPGATEANPANPDPAPTAEIPMPTDTPSAPPANAQCGPLAVFLPPGLASSYGCETIPEENDPQMPYFGIHPQYSKLTLSGYPLSDRLMDPHIDVFPLPRFGVLLPDYVNPKVSALQALISGGAPGDSALPLLPGLGAAEMLHAQYAVVPFQNGSGIRYVTMFGQALYPVNNHDMFLSYQGITADGQYWISMLIPITHPTLPPNGDNPPGGDWNAFYDTAEAYFDQVTADLNGRSPDSFNPPIGLVDTLIQSMVIQP